MFFFFFNDTATTEIYTLSLHDALPICSETQLTPEQRIRNHPQPRDRLQAGQHPQQDRKSTRLNSSHGYISYAVFCLKKKKKMYNSPPSRIIGNQPTFQCKT